MNARLAALATLLLASCASYTAPDSVVYGTAVITQHANGVTWTDYTTFSVGQTVAIRDETGSTPQDCTVAANAGLLQAIKDEMVARGYREATGLETPDLELALSSRLGSVEYWYSGGWCGWYPYYYCYPGWSYGGSYSFGTILLEMGDRKNAGVTMPLLWSDAAYGVLAGYYQGCGDSPSGINWTRIQAAVERGFQQSPYIQGPL